MPPKEKVEIQKITNNIINKRKAKVDREKKSKEQEHIDHLLSLIPPKQLVFFLHRWHFVSETTLLKPIKLL